MPGPALAGGGGTRSTKGRLTRVRRRLSGGWRLEDETVTEESMVKYQQALNDYFEDLEGGDGERPIMAVKGKFKKIKKRYADVILSRAVRPERRGRVKHSRLESWFSPQSLRVLADVARFGAADDAADAGEILCAILFGWRMTSVEGWDVRFTSEGHLECALGKLGEGGQLKTDSDVRFVGVQHREVPLPSAPQHPRYEWLLCIRRGLGFRHYSARTGKSASVRITANIRRLLPAEQLQLPSNRYLSSNACRKTMASAASAAGVPLATISQHGLWGVSSTTACKHYIDRTYPVQPYTAWVFDWLQPVSLVAPVIAVGV